MKIYTEKFLLGIIREPEGQNLGIFKMDRFGLWLVIGTNPAGEWVLGPCVADYQKLAIS